MHRRRNDMGLLEIDDGRAKRQQADPEADAEKIGRADHFGQRGEGVAADAAGLGLDAALRAGLRHGRVLKPIDAEHGDFQKRCCGDQEVDRPERHREPDGDDRGQERARRAAGADKAEQTLALLGAEQVGHERPEDGNREQIKHADPNKEHARDDHRRDVERQQQPERGQMGDKEMIDDGNEPRARQLRHQRARERLRDNERDERRGEQPRQVSHAG